MTETTRLFMGFIERNYLILQTYWNTTYGICHSDVEAFVDSNENIRFKIREPFRTRLINKIEEKANG